MDNLLSAQKSTSFVPRQKKRHENMGRKYGAKIWGKNMARKYGHENMKLPTKIWGDNMKTVRENMNPRGILPETIVAVCRKSANCR